MREEIAVKTRTSAPLSLCRFGVLLLLVALLSGCGMSMKGTPFGLDEYEERRGPDENRVNWWPLLYYRDPALSVLWPFFELTDKHAAIRPVFSVEGLDEDKQVYNFLWPIAQLDMHQRQHRVFPLVWWGDPPDEPDYTVVFPFYWHKGDPYGGDKGYDRLLPLWSYDKHPDGFDTWLLGPFLRMRRDTEEKRFGWHVWPLVGHYGDSDGYYRFALWPLMHQWRSESRKEYGDCAIPLYYRSKDRRGSRFYSLPYSSRNKANGDYWQLVPPLLYRAGGKDRSLLVTPLWAQGSSDADGSAWNAAIPFYLHRKTKTGRSVNTLLGGYSADGDKRSWWALPLLSGAEWDQDRGSWGALPLLGGGEWDKESWQFASLLGLIAGGRGERSYSHRVLPFYHYQKDEDDALFVSLPYSTGRHKDGSSWHLVPPLCYVDKSEDGGQLFTPLWAQGSSKKRGSNWHALIPLYYHGRTRDKTLLATLLGGYKTDGQEKQWLIYPLLTGGSVGDKRGEFWALAPLIHAKWDETATSHHVLPLYYWGGRENTFLSIAAASWRHGENKRTTLVPPALSWLTDSPQRKDLWLGGPLAHFSWGEKGGEHHVLPLFYTNSKTGTFASPLAAWWRSGPERKTYAAPPLLSWLSAGERRKDLWVVGPLARWSWGKDGDPQHVFPLYYANNKTGTFVSPALAWWRNNRGATTHLVPPLLSWLSAGKRRKDLWVAGPLGHWSWGEEGGAQHMFPFYAYKPDRYFYTPLVGWNNDKQDGFIYPLTPLVGLRRGKRSGFWAFPLINHERVKATGDYKGNFLLLGNYWGREEEGGSSFFPVYSYRNHGPIDSQLKGWEDHAEFGTDFFCLPTCYYQNKSVAWRTKDGTSGRRFETKSGVFPLWSYSKRSTPQTGRIDAEATFLSLFHDITGLAVYDYQRRVRPLKDRPGKVDDYVRKRFLFHLWHYERSNRNVSVDVFPAITYDSRTDGFWKFSLLWRLFRWDSHPDRGTNLDLLFIPILRARAEKKNADH